MTGSRTMELLDVLTELARSGQLGPVANGATWDTVTEALGEPYEPVVEARRTWPRLVAYGDLELSFCGCRTVVLICLQTWRDVITLPVGPVSRRTLPGRPTYPQVTAALDRAGCAWRPYPPLTFDDQCAIQATPSGVVLGFDIPDGEDPVLTVAGPQPHPHACPAATATHPTS